MATTALIGHALGADRKDQAELYAGQALTFALGHAMVVMLVGIAACPQIFVLMGAKGPYLDMAVSYMRALFAGTPVILINYACNAVLSACGDTRSFRNFLVAGFVLNLLFDPWFIYGGFGIPPMGLPGIAWATVVIQGVGTLYLLRMAAGTGLIGEKTWRLLAPRQEPLARLFSQGFPASLNMLTVSLGIFVITWFVGRYGTAAVAAYGVCTRIEQIVLLPVMGLNVATLAIVSQNFGAGQFNRVRQAVRVAFRAGLSITSIATLAVYFGAAALVTLFSGDPGVITAGNGYFKINAFVLGAYVVLYVNNAALQGLQRPAFALWIGLFRQLAAPLLAFPLLAVYFGWGLMGIWGGILLVTWCAAVISIIYTRHVLSVLVRGTTPLPAGSRVSGGT
jgi:putative MATE family efflux protein